MCRDVDALDRVCAIQNGRCGDGRHAGEREEKKHERGSDPCCYCVFCSENHAEGALPCTIRGPKQFDPRIGRCARRAYCGTGDSCKVHARDGGVGLREDGKEER